MEPFCVTTESVAIVIVGAIAGIESDYRQLLTIPVFGIRPVNLEVGVRKRIHILLHVAGSGLGLLRQVLCEHIAQRVRVLAGLRRLVPNAAAWRFYKLPQGVFFIVAVHGRRRCGVENFLHLLRSDRKRSKDPGQRRQFESGRIGLLGRRRVVRQVVRRPGCIFAA